MDSRAGSLHGVGSGLGAVNAHSQRQPRLSVFKEEGLLKDDSKVRRSLSRPCSRPTNRPTFVRFRSNSDTRAQAALRMERNQEYSLSCRKVSAFKEVLDESRAPENSSSRRPSGLRELGLVACLLAVMIPILNSLGVIDASLPPLLGVQAGVIRQGGELDRRQTTDTDVCKRWSQQTALVNGTLYLYGGRATTDPHQESNQWNNDFLTLDLTKSWELTKAPLTGLEKPNGPPPVSNGYLWASRTSLYLYGGEFSDTPPHEPPPFSTWEYNMHDNTWTEHPNPQTSSGTNAPSDGDPVGRAAEGAGFSVASLGRGWYFGGHQDGYTTGGPNWDPLQVPRVYLTSLLEYTFPGSPNPSVFSLGDGANAGDDGVYRNITKGGVSSDGFPERADGVLVYIPGFTKDGILLGIAGGTNDTFTQMNVIDVYDIAESRWYKQSTVGAYPKARVNPCMVVAAAPDGSSYNVYMFGGQALQPYLSQKQYNDMWILSLPSFTWIEVDQSGQSVPYGRSGHTCNIWDGQMVMVGGYIGQHISCESPGVYVFNTSSLEWATSFNSISGGSDNGNPFSQQIAQIGADVSSGLEGSFGYSVPKPVYKAVGGGPSGGATITKPAQAPTGGPLATGTPVTYTLTNPDGSTVTSTAFPKSSSGGGGLNVAAIVAGTVAGVLALVAAYFAFCAFLYRKQVQLYKNHVAMMTKSGGRGTSAGAGADMREKDSSALFPNSSTQPNTSSASSYAAAGGTGVAEDGIMTTGAATAGAGAGAGAAAGRTRTNSTGNVSDDDDLLAGREPSFWGTHGVLLHPRRSLRIINRD